MLLLVARKHLTIAHITHADLNQHIGAIDLRFHATRCEANSCTVMGTTAFDIIGSPLTQAHPTPICRAEITVPDVRNV